VDGFPERSAGLSGVRGVGFTLDRQLNASLNIYLKMCGFPHLFLTPTGSRWVGVTPLKGAEEDEWGNAP